MLPLIGLALELLVDAVPGDRASTAVEVTFCELVAHPESYDNRHVRVTTRVVAGFETSALYDEACPTDNGIAGHIWLDAKDDGTSSYYVGWSMSDFVQAARAGQLNAGGPDVEWKVPSPVSRPPEAHTRALDRALSKSHDHLVWATVTGRFDFAGRGRLSRSRGGQLGFAPGFGHLNSFSRRVVMEDVVVERRRR